METVAFLINPTKLTRGSEAAAAVGAAVERFRALGRRVLVSDTAADLLPVPVETASADALAGEAGLLVVVGGDGTILHGARLSAGRVPLLGVRTGGFGFLAELNVEELPEAVPRLARGDFAVEPRMMLEAAVERDGVVRDRYLALNDAVVTGTGVARVLRLRAYVNDELLASYPADGLIVATPTGSTAYSLSAGGPIVHPRVEVLIITPINPHTFNARAVIVGADARVTVEVDPPGRPDAEPRLTVDGQAGQPVHPGERVVARRAEAVTRLVRLSRPSFYGILRAKLAWGERA